MPIVVDDSKFPLIVITFDGHSTDAEFETYLERLTEVSRREGSKAFLFDARGSGGSPPSQRKRMTHWMTHEMLASRSGFACVAFVLSSPVVRGVLTAILWVAPLRLRHGIFAELDEARSFCQAQIEAREARKARAFANQPAPRS